jgi:mRNA-degrading endonuclease RelE of RelBE toxin-antitoxin system
MSFKQPSKPLTPIGSAGLPPHSDRLRSKVPCHDRSSLTGLADETEWTRRSLVCTRSPAADRAVRNGTMFQVTFSDQSIRELNKLDKLAQLAVVEPISALTQVDLANPHEPLGRFTRSGRTFYRLRAGDFRFYFEVKGDTLHTHYILHKDSLEDFLFRTKLPVSEQQLFEQHSKFWKYLESLTTTPKK